MAYATGKNLSLEFNEETMSDSEKSTVYRTINSNIISVMLIQHHNKPSFSGATQS